jgi:hypothetical protein
MFWNWYFEIILEKREMRAVIANKHLLHKNWQVLLYGLSKKV